MTDKDRLINEALALLTDANKLQTDGLKLLKDALALPEHRKQAVVTSIKLAEKTSVTHPIGGQLVCVFCNHAYPWHHGYCEAGPHKQAQWHHPGAAAASAPEVINSMPGFAVTIDEFPEPHMGFKPPPGSPEDLAHAAALLHKPAHGGRPAPFVEFRSPLSGVVGEG